MDKLAIVLTYFNRERQLLNTLESFRQYDYDFSVVIVDDNSPEDLNLPEYPFRVTILKLGPKTWVNPSPIAFNTGFNYALKENPDIIIIQNAECYHVGDVVGYALKNITERNYLAFGCYSLAKDEDVTLKNLKRQVPLENGGSGWYNHSKYRPEAFHFCTAISTNNLKKINGFDERFSMGIGWEDNYLVHQVKMAGLKITFVDDPFVFHQWHYNQVRENFDMDLYKRTEQYYRMLILDRKYHAVHLVPNSDL